jgi:prepilin-type N-terminal cleavage/methylation domain-containing protein
MMRARQRRPRGFTLVELLVVIAVVAMVAALAATTMRSTRGDRVASFSRALVAQVNMVRHTAIAQQQATRLLVQKSGATYTLAAQVWNPTANGFQDLGATLNTPMDVQMCVPDSAAVMTASSPTCPLTASFAVCFLPSGGSFLQTTTSCAAPAGGFPAGATLYADTVTGDKKLKLPLFGLTGMAKLMDQW